MASTSTKVGHGLAKALGIKLDYRNDSPASKLSRGESVFSVDSADTYVEHEPTAAEWLREVIPSGRDVLHYFINLFPFTKWILRYNVQWLIGDLIAGITVGAVVVPQSMAYAQLANLPVEYGLYSSFMGVLIYWFFATSKDITIGPVAVMSTIVGNIVASVAAKDPSIEGHVVASALAVIVGAIVCFLGLIRMGWIVEVISLASISAFMTGSAINIAVGQVPALMGISSKIVNNRASTYLVVINTLKHLGSSKLDAALGLTALVMLYLIRSSLNFAARKNPNHKKLYFFISTLRTAFVILLYTMISWLMNLNLKNHDSKNSPIAILGTVPRGFRHAAVPTVNSNIITLFASELPASVIVLLIEHISISKSFGRVNNYTIDPSQELVAIGVSNLLGPFLGAYPATGSFSRTAIKSKAGVRTPFAGVITAVIVLLSIYALPAVFFYIPKAALSAVIIHAVGDLITPPNTVYQFWKVSPLEVPIFFAGVIVTIFTTIEIGVYVTISASAAILFFRLFKAQGRFVGKVKVHDVKGDGYVEGEDKRTNIGSDNDANKTARDVYLPFASEDGSNPAIQPRHPYPGVFIYRFSEGFNYPNANHYLDHLTKTIFAQTQRTNPHSYARPGDRPWNDPGPRPGKEVVADDHRPTLKAVVVDFSSVNNVDLTSIQNLIDVRNQLDRYTAPERVQWHIACVNNRWTKRALANAGFGYPSVDGEATFDRWKPIFSVAELGGSSSAAAAGDEAYNKQLYSTRTKDVENNGRPDEDSINASEGSSDVDRQLNKSGAYREGVKVAVVQGLNRPFFHIDVTSAVQSAVHNIQAHGKNVD
ncbi:Putative SLC26A/SulP transporter, STAS domain, sulfate anion transporter, STAS domain superfamily [Septoria linicola]|uniref:SLC26A/SulP transporter, STAS domain, sulfate anion transporter, STAS domain superfamily n=1 Tax=Septoria linicola TaxID=215465 RepID=A0A9Q9ARL3_9PEZI|nr:putative SLC26A/SulP transporter, STAS domain, sulfate anion transporter, STAS domain superfamily [Septoria linicola]USW54139.1 Putative SLC26A/SulP transporter, STAS domain, sulfate anion transporter, STAS domain superfamily [Septoria linicola]